MGLRRGPAQTVLNLHACKIQPLAQAAGKGFSWKNGCGEDASQIVVLPAIQTHLADGLKASDDQHRPLSPSGSHQICAPPQVSVQVDLGGWSSVCVRLQISSCLSLLEGAVFTGEAGKGQAASGGCRGNQDGRVSVRNGLLEPSEEEE